MYQIKLYHKWFFSAILFAMKKKISPITILQSFFLCFKFFLKNNLYTHASSCALGFLFSIIPLLMLILIVLVRFFNATPDLLFNFVDTQSLLLDTDKTRQLILNILSTRRINSLEILLPVFLLWMSRRFFLSIRTAIRAIFHGKIKTKPFFPTLLLFFAELLIVISIASLIAISAVVNSFFSSSISSNVFFLQYIPISVSNFFTSIGIILAKLIPQFIVGIITLLIFKFVSGTKPSWFLCIFFSIICVISVIIIQRWFSFFLISNRYNVIYGILSSLIVLLLEVFIFFIIFLICAQMIYIIQFFDDLLLTELYLLPHRNETKPTRSLSRILFMRPDYYIKKGIEYKKYEKGEIIFNENDLSYDVFFIASGIVGISTYNYRVILDNGSFFGEISSFMHQKRHFTAKAESSVLVLSIPQSKFMSLISTQSDISQKLLQIVSTYSTHIYGRK